MKVAIVGTGYVGLVSGVCLAAKGHEIICVDINSQIVGALNSGVPHIYEEGLPELLKQVRNSGNFSATTDLWFALDNVNLVIIAVGTPSDQGIIDLQFIREVSRSIGQYIGTTDRHISVVVKSTVVPGTTDTVVRGEIERASGKTFPAFGLGMNPEFLREGEAIKDFSNPDRIVFGYEDVKTLERFEALYAPWEADKIRVNTRTAELIKYANNALLATQISAVNEIANLAAALGGIDVMDVLNGVHLDKRWNPIVEGYGRISPEILSYLVPGCGFGGSCFPKDVQALRSQGERLGLPMQILNAVLEVNEAQPDQVFKIIEYDLPLFGKQVLVLGLAFKPGTDDVRESASFKIVLGLIKKGASVVAHDPIAIPNFKELLGESGNKVEFVNEWLSHVAKADIVIVATKWPEYNILENCNFKDKILFDTRRMFQPKAIVGFSYRAIGLRII